jgi:Eukaryotic aspartyl protease
VTGVYYTDDVTVGSASLNGIIIAVVSGDFNEPRGIMGVGLPSLEATDIPEHPGVIQLLYNQGYILSQSYSLYLDDYGKLSLGP